MTPDCTRTHHLTTRAPSGDTLRDPAVSTLVWVLYLSGITKEFSRDSRELDEDAPGQNDAKVGGGLIYPTFSSVFISLDSLMKCSAGP